MVPQILLKAHACSEKMHNFWFFVTFGIICAIMHSESDFAVSALVS